MKLVTALFSAVFLLNGAARAATTYKVAPDDSPVGFVAVGKPGFLRIKGEGAKLNGSGAVDGDVLTGTFAVDLRALHTGIDLRDEHMKGKYLETEKFPEALLELTGTKISVTDAGDYDLAAMITVKGVKKPLTVRAKLTPTDGGSRIDGDATFKIKLSDFAVGVPSYLGVTVAEDVDVAVKLRASKS